MRHPDRPTPWHSAARRAGKPYAVALGWTLGANRASRDVNDWTAVNNRSALSEFCCVSKWILSGDRWTGYGLESLRCSWRSLIENTCIGGGGWFGGVVSGGFLWEPLRPSSGV